MIIYLEMITLPLIAVGALCTYGSVKFYKYQSEVDDNEFWNYNNEWVGPFICGMLGALSTMFGVGFYIELGVAITITLFLITAVIVVHIIEYTFYYRKWHSTAKHSLIGFAVPVVIVAILGRIAGTLM